MIFVAVKSWASSTIEMTLYDGLTDVKVMSPFAGSDHVVQPGSGGFSPLEQSSEKVPLIPILSSALLVSARGMATLINAAITSKWNDFIDGKCSRLMALSILTVGINQPLVSRFISVMY